MAAHAQPGKPDFDVVHLVEVSTADEREIDSNGQRSLFNIKLLALADNTAGSVPSPHKGRSDSAGSLFAGLVVPTLVLRNDDRALTSCRVLFETYRNDGTIYDALVQIAMQRRTQIPGDMWAIRVGYTELAKASGCSRRTLQRAWPNLLKWGFVESIAPYQERVPKVYVVRSTAAVDAIYAAAGCTHIRIMRGGTIQPFRAEPPDERIPK